MRTPYFGSFQLKTLFRQPTNEGHGSIPAPEERENTRHTNFHMWRSLADMSAYNGQRAAQNLRRNASEMDLASEGEQGRPLRSTAGASRSPLESGRSVAQTSHSQTSHSQAESTGEIGTAPANLSPPPLTNRDVIRSWRKWLANQPMYPYKRSAVLWHLKQALHQKRDRLELSNLNLKTLPPNLEALTHLKKLDLRNNQLTDVNALANLQGLAWVRLQQNPLTTDISPAFFDYMQAHPDVVSGMPYESVESARERATADLTKDMYDALPEKTLGEAGANENDICPITCEPLESLEMPVVLKTGNVYHLYDYRSLKSAISRKPENPISREPLTLQDLQNKAGNLIWKVPR